MINRNIKPWGGVMEETLLKTLRWEKGGIWHMLNINFSVQRQQYPSTPVEQY